MGSPIYANRVPDFDDVQSERLKAAGAIFIGKTNTSEFGLGSNTYNPVFGFTGNAYHPGGRIERRRGERAGAGHGARGRWQRHAGLVAKSGRLQQCLRFPAKHGHVLCGPLGEQWVSQLSTEGPMGCTVEDLAMLLSVQVGRDDRAPLSPPGSWPGEMLDLDRDLGPVRIGWSGDLRGHLADKPGILERCVEARAASR